MTSGFDQLERELRDAEARLAGQLPRFKQRRPSLLASSAVAVAGALVSIAVVVVAVVALHGAKPSTGPVGTARMVVRYTNPEGWSIAFPRDLHLSAATTGTVLQQGQITVTNFSPARFLRGELRTGTSLEPGKLPFSAPLDSGGRFPSGGIALILQPGQFTVLGADSRFPISVNTFHALSTSAFFSKTTAMRAALPAARSRLIVAYSEPLTATILIGSKAPIGLQRQLAGTIASLTFRALSPGTQVGPGVLLGPATDYPIGSFTRIEVRFPGGPSEPIYLVHAPGRLTDGHSCVLGAPCTAAGSFYGIGGNYNTRRNHAPVCAIKLDPRNQVFGCANLAVRWDRVGRVISRPADESYIGSIEGLDAKICWNGQVMISQGFGPQLSRAAVHELWPSWHQPNEPLSR
jgi:hypothetical protein